MPEKDFIVRKSEITAKIEDINGRLGMMSCDSDGGLSDGDFIRQASHLLLNSQIQNREYIYYKNLAASIAPDVLRSYVHTVIDSIHLKDGKVSCIVFKNGMAHRFLWK